jgi:hypothetical protein
MEWVSKIRLSRNAQRMHCMSGAGCKDCIGGPQSLSGGEKEEEAGKRVTSSTPSLSLPVMPSRGRVKHGFILQYQLIA